MATRNLFSVKVDNSQPKFYICQKMYNKSKKIKMLLELTEHPEFDVSTTPLLGLPSFDSFVAGVENSESKRKRANSLNTRVERISESFFEIGSPSPAPSTYAPPVTTSPTESVESSHSSFTNKTTTTTTTPSTKPRNTYAKGSDGRFHCAFPQCLMTFHRSLNLRAHLSVHSGTSFF